MTTEQILSFTRDCASLGYAGANIAGLIVWLADHKFCDVACSGFHFPKHGKCSVDDIFGLIELLWRHLNIFSTDTSKPRPTCASAGPRLRSAIPHAPLQDAQAEVAMPMTEPMPASCAS